MGAMTLTIIFNKDKDKVLMCYHEKFGKYNFIGGKVEDDEDWYPASIRELEEETGIGVSDLCKPLRFVRHEIVSTFCSGWDMYVTAGVLKHDIILKQERNPLYWLDIKDASCLISNEAIGDGNCYMFYKEACAILELGCNDEVCISNLLTPCQ